MSLSAYRKATLAVSLARGGKITLGDSTYRLKGFVVNHLAVKHNTEAREPWLDVVFQTVLRCRQGAFLDVGTNIGQTMFKILSLEASRQYFGFEPQVSCCFLVQHFLEENHLGTCAVLPVGLSNKNGLVRLYRQGKYDSSATIVKNFRPEASPTSYCYVCLRKGDEVISELQITSISAIKIDVEGAELEVIEGLLDTIRATMPFIVFEVLNHFVVGTGRKLDDQHIRLREDRIKRMENILRQCGYAIFNILPANILKKVRRIAPPVSSDLSLTNYIAVSNQDLEHFLQVFPGSILDSMSDPKIRTG